MPEFVMEIGFEEMPARFLEVLTRDFENNLSRNLHAHMLDCEKIMALSTPRRLCAYICGLDRVQKQKQEVLFGPPVSIGLDQDNNPTRAGLGFARSQQVDVSELIVRETEKGTYLAVQKTVGGKNSEHILPEICANAVKELGFSKKMRWSGPFTFGRPIRWILALLDEQVIDFQISDVRSSFLTYGHRVLGPGPFKISRASDYFKVIREQGKVVLDSASRQEIIQSGSKRLAESIKGLIIANDALVRENVNLAEYPRPILGRFDSIYLELPREVLLTSMQTHQKSFGLNDEHGKVLPYFVAVINNNPDDPALIRKGWERVLKARLEDARFFWEADKAASFDEWLEKLEKVVFLAPLGSMAEKARRLERVSGYLCDNLHIAEKKDVQTAALICKTDLVSEMVGEFPDLQGIMGGIYAAHAGYNDNIARAVYEHYLPLGPEFAPPSSSEGAIVSLADKADNLAGCFGLDMLPSGAADPYALRRQALGMIRIILEHGLKINLKDLLSFSCRTYIEVEWKQDPDQALEKLLQFFAARLKAYWQSRGIDNKLVEAVIQSGFLDILSAEHRLLALRDFSRHHEFEAAVLTFKRVDNIIRKQAGAAGVALSEGYDPDLLQEDHELKLDRAIKEIMSDWDMLWKSEEFKELFAKLHALRPYVDGFFDHVMVMCDDVNLRQNRINMLNFLAKKFEKLADFSALQV